MTNLKTIILGAVSLAGITAAMPAFADDAPAAPTWSLAGTIDVQSDYKFRGISQNDRTPSPQGTLNLSGPEGFYIGTWASTVDFTPGNSGNPYLELDIYGGKHTDLWGVDWNFEPYYYSYPAEKYGAGPNADYLELINQFTKAFGPVTVQGTYAWSPNLGFNGGTGNYLAGNLAYTVNDWLSISGNLGHQWAQNAKYATPKSRDYTYGDIGATATWKMFSLDVRYSGTDLSGAQCSAFYMATTHACAGDFVATLNYNFTLLP
jgi:uncharacterized protein (TIGR02001 family)